jgi:hypothetical protein
LLQDRNRRARLTRISRYATSSPISRVQASRNSLSYLYLIIADKHELPAGPKENQILSLSFLLTIFFRYLFFSVNYSRPPRGYVNSPEILHTFNRRIQPHPDKHVTATELCWRPGRDSNPPCARTFPSSVARVTAVHTLGRLPQAADRAILP